MRTQTGRGEARKINFTRREHRALVEMLILADWVIRSQKEQPRKETEP